MEKSELIKLKPQSLKSLLSLFLSFNFRSLRSSSTVQNFLSIGISSLLSNLIGLITLGYSARILGPENYGLVVFGTSTVAYASLLVVPGLTKWGIRAVAQHRENAGEYIITINIVRVTLALIAYLGLIFYVSNRSLTNAENTIILLSGLALFSQAFMVDWAFFGLERMRIPAALNVISSVLNTVCLLLFIKSPSDAYKLPVIGFGIQILIHSVLYLIILLKFRVKIVMPTLLDVRTAIILSLPISIMSFITIAYKNANNLIIKENIGLAATGIFYAAFRLIDLANIFVQMVNQILYPRLSRLFTINRDYAALETGIYIRILLSIGFGIGAFLFSEAESIIQLIYGQGYESAVTPLQIMSFVVVFGVSGVSYAGIMIPFKKDKIMLFITISMAAVAIIGGLLLIPSFEIIGAAITFVLIDLVALIASIFWYRKIIGTFNFQAWIFPLIGFVIVVICSTFMKVNNTPTLVRFIMEGLIYSAFLLLNLTPIFQLIGKGSTSVHSSFRSQK